jgi:c-di-GMP-binding flagellar brake protein YcgR
VKDPEKRPAGAAGNLLRHLQPLTLEVVADDSASRYSSLVLDYTEGQEIIVGVPMVQGREIRLDAGTELTIFTSQADGLRIFSCTVLRRRELPSPCLYLSWPDSIRRVQRRENVRVEVLLPVTVQVQDDEQLPQVLHGSTRDLSAGGVQIGLSEAPQLSTPVEVRLHIEDDNAVVCEGRVVRVEANPRSTSERRYWVAIEFTALPENVRRPLTRFVFDVQREQMRRGLD